MIETPLRIQKNPRNGDSNKEAFDEKLKFNIKFIPYVDDDSWIVGTILDI